MINGVEASVIGDVLSFFGAGPARSIEPVSNGISNRNYIVHNDENEYVVRFLANQSVASVENDVAIQRQLRSTGVPAPEYLRSVSGQYVYEGGSGLRAVISPRLSGITPIQITPVLSFDIGRHLGLFHASVASLPRPNKTGLINPAVAPVTSPTAREILDQPLPRGIIHGDLHGGNVLVDPADQDRVTAILDFEEAGENLYLIDLAVTLMAVSARPDSDFDPALFRAAREGYESVRTLTGEEKAWLRQAIAYASEAWINWFRENGFEKYARQHERRVESFRALLSNREIL